MMRKAGSRGQLTQQFVAWSVTYAAPVMVKATIVNRLGDRQILRMDRPQRGARLARMRWSVRRCMLRRRAVSETLRPHNS